MALIWGQSDKKKTGGLRSAGAAPGYSANTKPPTAPMRGNGIAALAAQQAARQPAPGSPPIPTAAPRSLVGAYAQRQATGRPTGDTMMKASDAPPGQPPMSQLPGELPGGAPSIPTPSPGAAPQSAPSGYAPSSPSSPAGGYDPRAPGGGYTGPGAEAGDADPGLYPAPSGEPGPYQFGPVTLPFGTESPSAAGARPEEVYGTTPTAMNEQDAILNQLYEQILGGEFGIGEEAKELEKNIWDKATQLSGEQAEGAAAMGVGGAGLTDAGFGDVMSAALGESRQLQFDTANLALEDEMNKINIFLSTAGQNLDRDQRLYLEEKKIALQEQQNDLLGKQYGKNDFQNWLANSMGIADIETMSVEDQKALEAAWNNAEEGEEAAAALALWKELMGGGGGGVFGGGGQPTGEEAPEQTGGKYKGWSQKEYKDADGNVIWSVPEDASGEQWGADQGGPFQGDPDTNKTIDEEFMSGKPPATKQKIEKFYDDVYAYMKANPGMNMWKVAEMLVPGGQMNWGGNQIGIGNSEGEGKKPLPPHVLEMMEWYIYDKLHKDGKLKHYLEDVQFNDDDLVQKSHEGAYGGTTYYYEPLVRGPYTAQPYHGWSGHADQIMEKYATGGEQYPH